MGTCSQAAPGTGLQRCTARGWGRLLAVLPGLGDVPRVGVFCDGLTHLAIAVGGEEGSRLDEEAEAVVKGVPFLWPVFREEAVAQRVIAHHVLDLQGPRPRDLSPSVQVFPCPYLHSANVTR